MTYINPKKDNLEWENIESLGVHLPLVILTWKDYLTAMKEKDILTAQNCCYYYTWTRDLAIKRGEDVHGLPKKLKLPRETRF